MCFGGKQAVWESFISSNSYQRSVTTGPRCCWHVPLAKLVSWQAGDAEVENTCRSISNPMYDTFCWQQLENIPWRSFVHCSLYIHLYCHTHTHTHSIRGHISSNRLANSQFPTSSVCAKAINVLLKFVAYFSHSLSLSLSPWWCIFNSHFWGGRSAGHCLCISCWRETKLVAYNYVSFTLGCIHLLPPFCWKLSDITEPQFIQPNAITRQDDSTVFVLISPSLEWWNASMLVYVPISETTTKPAA